VRTLIARPGATAGDCASSPGAGAYLSGLGLTLTNPVTILAFVAIFAGAGFAQQGAGWAATALIGGTFLGSAVWWLLLSSGVVLLRRSLADDEVRWSRTLGWINWLSGAVLLGFGLYAIVRALV
jgi:threonine/homoserine/homoserine lactone efflux protein